MKRIVAVTTARSDYGIYRPVFQEFARHAEFDLSIVAGGMHLSPEFGMSVSEIERDGFTVAERVEMLLSSDSASATAKSIGLGVIGFAEVFQRLRPDLVLVLGDRFEMHAATLATVPFQLPVAHIHGGEVTDGAIDDALRHGISKMAHLHFVATDEYGKRLERLGEEPWRITTSGAPALDNLNNIELLSSQELFGSLGVPELRAPLIVTYHPVTRRPERADAQIGALLAALALRSEPIVFTMPNADPGNRAILARIKEFAEGRSATYFFENLGTQRYFSLMKAASAMLGNSSSGIIEAASFKLPVVNIGSRQDGRARNTNVIDVAHDEDAGAIGAAIQHALSDEFRQMADQTKNIFGDGRAAKRIVTRLGEVNFDQRLREKRFYDV